MHQNKNFEGENCASTILVEHTIGYDMNLFGYDIILFGSILKFQELPVMLVAIPINFGVKNQVPQVSFKIATGDLMSVFSHEFDDIIFCESLVIFEAISYYGAQAFSLHSPRASLPTFFYHMLISSQN